MTRTALGACWERFEGLAGVWVPGSAEVPPLPGPDGHVVLGAGVAAIDAQAVREDAENETFVEAAYPSEG